MRGKGNREIPTSLKRAKVLFKKKGKWDRNKKPEQQEKRGKTESGHSLINSQQCNLRCPWFLNEAKTSS